jgi:protein-disulfide isomerase
MRSVLTGFCCLLLLATAIAADDAKAKSTFDKAAFEAYVRHLLIWGPQIQVTVSDPEPSELDGFSKVTVSGTAGQASQETSFFVSKDGSKMLTATVYDLDKNPFHKSYEQIDTSNQPAVGTRGAPVRLVLFTDFQCPFCRQQAALLRDNLIKTYPEQVRLYFKDFPLSSIHPWAMTAAIAGRCVYNQSEAGFWTYHDSMFEHQQEITIANITDKIAEFTGSIAGIDTLRLNRCIENNESLPEVTRSIKEAGLLGINSTPTLFINGRRLSQQLPWQNLKQIIDFELDYQETAKNAGDVDCCAVKLPTPLAQ